MTNRTFKSVIWLAAGIALAACSEFDSALDSAERTPITLTTTIAQTRAITPTQETALATGENIYVWANEEDTKGTADWTQNAYLCAWRLTRGSGSPEWSSQSSQPYFPPRPLSMVALHGNFQPSMVEERTGVPATVTHLVKIDQSSAASFALSDLLYWHATGINAVENSPISVQFAHKLSKIEIELVSTDYTESDLAAATVTLNGLKPQMVMTVTDATPANMGALAAASGSAQTIKPYAANGNQREAIVPPQARPANLITLTIDGHTYTLSPSEPASDFESGKRYLYTLTLTHSSVNLKTEVTAWGTTAIAVTNETAVSPRNVKLNPLWYVAKTNLNQDGASFSTIHSTSQGYMFLWSNAMSLGYTAQTTTYDGYAVPATPKAVGNDENHTTWHMPTEMEWAGIVPFDIFVSTKADMGIYDDKNVTFGYNNDTKFAIGNTSNPATPTGNDYKSYWSAYVTDSNIRYAIRFLGTPYCSVWRYRLLDLGTTSGRLEISSRLIDPINEDETDKLAAMLTTIQASDFDWSENEAEGAVQRILYACGYSASGAHSASGSTENGTHGYYHSATEKSDNTTVTWRMYYRDGAVCRASDTNKSYGIPVRLFRDNTKAKTTVASAKAGNLEVGDIVCSNGLIFSVEDVAAIAEEGHTPVGIIAYVGTPGSVDTSSATYKALVIAMKDANSGDRCFWYTSNTGTCVNQTNNFATAITYLNGIACTNTLVSDGHTHAAASAARNYAVARPSGTSEWFLPSVGQFNLILKGLTGSNTNFGYGSSGANDAYKNTNVNTRILASGGTGFLDVYWLSTEFSTNSAYTMSFGSGCASANTKNYHEGHYVRAVFAF